MPLAEDQQQAGDLDTRGEHKPFRLSIRTAAAELVRTSAGLALPAALRRAGRYARSATGGNCSVWIMRLERPKALGETGRDLANNDRTHVEQ